MTRILQNKIPYDVENPRALPGIQPATMENWLHQDEAFADQMRRREEILSERRDDVLALDPGAKPAAVELLDLVLMQTYPTAVAEAARPDGVSVAIDRDRPLDTLCRLVQEDFCILQKRGNEHVLTGAILCFPASWRLSEKFMRPLIDIHVPVESYDANVAKRVQRLFDGIQPGRPLWRFNALWYEDPELFQPRSASEPREIRDRRQASYLRSERQTLLRLPKTNAVVFSIHTYILAANAIPKTENPA
ncbi:DUF3445 domain-containing protein [Ruegeria sp. HKCCD6428]|uniref:heme-dependent oxidative N-demethylase family protein n=1 Tax=Ruegeria sp. HKCCD6428 TaxID=2683002 RepID=UPI001491744E|nr:DUF3445 domain-containing protein [Ruegeria sp. HKCCD6428]NOC82782.1 DUF3445 domain-containing protein [Ruegeria sp. HKCCD6428]